jgi:hypothetical protein
MSISLERTTCFATIVVASLDFRCSLEFFKSNFETRFSVASLVNSNTFVRSFVPQGLQGRASSTKFLLGTLAG